ncbi:MAG: carboxypeptidase-like regulatory domain-containing protein, partial [bacterium]
MSLRRQITFFVPLVLLMLSVVPAWSQTDTATLSGLITDPQGRVVPGVEVVVTNLDTNVSASRTTNEAGLYVVSGLKPGRYRVSYAKQGFRKVDLVDLVLNVQDALSRNLQLQLGPVETSITVTAERAKINTNNASVSTVVDRQFAENIPLNGRSFQTLIALTPGTVVT